VIPLFRLFLLIFIAISATLAADTTNFIATHPPRFYPGSEFPGAKGNLTISDDSVIDTHFDFSGGGNYVETIFDLDGSQAVKSISFTADKSPGYIFTVRARDASGQTFQKTLNHRRAGWAQFRFDMNNWTGHWGGSDDGVLQQPLKGFSILIENTRQKESAGSMKLKDIVLEPYTDAELARHKSLSAHLYTRCIITDFREGVNSLEPRSFSTYPGGLMANGELRIDFSKNAQINISHSISIPGEPQELLLTVEADPDAAGAEFELGIGSHFMTYTRTLGTLKAPLRKGQKIRQTFVVPAPPAEGWKWAGGANDGKPNYPLRFSHLKIRKGESVAKPVKIRLVSLEASTFLSRSKSLALRTRLLPNGECPATLTGQLSNLDDSIHSGRLTVDLKNWDGQTFATVGTNLSALLPGCRQTFTMPLPKPPQHQNFVETVTTYCPHDSDQQVSWTSTWTAPLPDTGTAERHPESPWGMGIYLYRNGNDPAGRKNMERVASMAQTAGVKWSREEFQWQRIEPKRGQFDFTFYDQLVNTAEAHGITLYALVAYWTPWTQPYEEEGFKDYCTFLRALVRRYKGRIKHWEIYNEPNIFFWSGPHERYPVLLKMAYDAVKEEDPEAQVLGCSTAGIDTPFIQMCLDAKAPFDTLTIHPYRGELHEEGFIQDLTSTRQQINNRPIWITEMGWPTIPGSATEREQATRLARAYLAAIGSGACQNICWYNFRNDGWNPYYNEDNFGIMQQDLVPKPAYRALASVCRTFTSGTPSLTRMPISPASGSIYLFRMGQAAALWTDSVHVALRVKTKDNPHIRNLMGEAVQAETKDGWWIVETDVHHPLFFPDTELTEAELLHVPVAIDPGIINF